MCYLRTNFLHCRKAQKTVEYFIEWDGDAVQQNISCDKELFSAVVSERNDKKSEIAKAKTIAKAQEIIDEYHGEKIPGVAWIQYRHSVNHDDKKYIIYKSWDSTSCKYIVAVKQGNCGETCPGAEVSEKTMWDALDLTGANLSPELLDIVKEDIRSGILDQYLPDHKKITVKEYITDGTQDLVQEMWRSQGSQKTFPLLLSLFMKALVEDGGTYALPKFSAAGEISQCLRWTYQEDEYELNTRLCYNLGVWRFAGESLHINGKTKVWTSRNADGSYNKISIPFSQSQVKCHLPGSFINMAEAFLEKCTSIH